MVRRGGGKTPCRWQTLTDLCIIPENSEQNANMPCRMKWIYPFFSYLCDHCNTFRDENDNTVVTFSPYGLGGHGGGSMQIGRWEIEISDLSIYGYGTKTVVARSIW